MKKLFFSLLILLTYSVATTAQKVNPAKWSWTLSKATPAVGETVDIIFSVDILDDWYLYSSDFSEDLGPTVTTIKLKANDSYEAVGGLKAINPSKKFDKEIWNGEYTYFKHKATFRQSIKILKPKFLIEGSYDSQSCSDASGLCVPVKGNFSLTGAEKKNDSSIEEKAIKTATESTTLTPVVKDSAEVKTDSVIQADTLVAEKSNSSVASETATLPAEQESLFAFFWVAFGAGLLALLTPCVYPLIPMTVSFFTKQKGGRKLAFLYGFSIVAIYVLFGTLIAALAGPGFANWLSTHWAPNLLFFVIFVFFGISFLGWFEIVLPSNFVNKIDAQSDRGGLIGVFFMAFTLVLVSFSCTGPVAGSILIASAQGEIIKPIIGMLGFSLAFAIPFTLFAIFPQWLKNLPKSGGWMNSVKVILGFLELALALKFLSTADQVYHWGILDREVYLALWIVIFSLIGFYLLGKIQLPHDSQTDKVSVPKMLLAILVFAFVVYMVPGMFGAPLKALAGWLPPLTTQDFVSSGTSVKTEGDANFPKPKYGEFLTLPHGLQGFFDYEEAVAYAKKVNKPIFIDFTGHGCVNCRKMEENVWSNPAVLKRLKEDYVVVALYVDDKTELPKEKWYISKDDGQEKTSMGDQNLDFQIVRFNGNAQPYYCLVNPNEDKGTLAPPKAFDSKIENFVKFLDEGKAKYALK
ncbi:MULTISPECIES: cytochrome c biogenesis protein CcdA [unclassified Arcicella]|uniref:protein-disulfide reductase DsbD family protein n=1 Tax=unclassified Arcicella TaxID=2644986 RepID=UPI00286299F1|nr:MULTISPECIES: cytochrome c biogenesis protein CcdA [unclassified Arcicella]MDR6563358.1 thiol:disulfide interchange protein DsbD [Arcicella sp. BE51]MDR6813221.1 thiol:disulfide interchange protein DsbD [Arcicella sp. BE140]MDR6824535.1 thiol:disulfide interchange protein DsbD [Arcicella sp. BE139]